MASRWRVLRPWADALNQVLVRPETFNAEPVSAMVEVECFPDNFDYSAFGFEATEEAESCILFLAIRADEATRRDRQQLQRVREAIDLFQVLAVVNGAAFEDLIPDFYGDSSGVIRVEWRLFLIGTISPADQAATKPTVTWGELFGFPENPWDTSADFCEAMRRVKGMARPGSGGEEPDLVNVLLWDVSHEDILVRGRQEPPRDEGPIAPLDVFSRRVGCCFEMDAPPVVQVAAVGSNDASVVEMWGQEAPVAQLDNTIIEHPIYSAPIITQVTAALARSEVRELTIGLGDAAADRQSRSLAVAGAGYLFSTVLCGNPVYRRQSGNQDLVALPRRTELLHITVAYDVRSTMRFEGIYSALAEAFPVQAITVEYDPESDEDRYNLPPCQSHCEWLAYAFWSTASKFPARSLRISYMTLTDNDVAAVRRVLETNYPQPVQPRDQADTTQYGFVDISAGTTVQHCVAQELDDSAFVFAKDYRCRALYDPSNSCSQADVVVPGYGICKLDLGASTNAFVSDSAVEASHSTNRNAGIEFLDLTLSRVESGRALIDLLALVGGRLTSLRIYNSRRSKIDLSLSALAASCPNLEVLSIDHIDVDAASNDGALLGWGLQELTIHDSDEVAGLANLLSDSACRMSRELVKLEILLSDRPISHDYVEALEAHDQEYLPVVQEKFPIESKTAMISVVKCSPEPTKTSRMSYKTHNRKALRSLDDNVLSLIFQFAATPKQRSVQISS